MDYGILRVSETETAEIEPARATVIIIVTSEKIVFGNAAVTASEDLKSVIDKVKTVSAEIRVDTEAVSVATSSGVFGKNSTATYTVKLTVPDLSVLGAIIGICTEGKKITVRSVNWEYDEEEAKLELIKKAVRKAKRKADDMMGEIGYAVVGIRSCSDSYQTPNVGEIIISQPPAFRSGDTVEMARSRAYSAVDIGVQFKSKKEIAATCTLEFLVKEKT